MPPTPISRDSMRLRRSQTLEAQRTQKIDTIVSRIYMDAVHVAEGTENSKYLYNLPDHNTTFHEFLRANMAEILDRVRSLFPECSVEHTTMARTADGNMCDISKIDANWKPFLSNNITEYIVVDWS